MRHFKRDFERAQKIEDSSKFNFFFAQMLRILKVKCNESWTIFLLSKNLYKKVSNTIMKQNRLLKISFVRPAAHKTRKTDDFRELHENEQEMAALEWKRNYRYL